MYVPNNPLGEKGDYFVFWRACDSNLPSGFMECYEISETLHPDQPALGPEGLSMFLEFSNILDK
jgi:hypothetical protein